MVDKSILRRIMLRLQSPEKRLLSSQNLHRTSRVLRQVQQATRMADQPRSDELSDQSSQVGRDGDHAIPEVLRQLGAVGGDGDDLVAEGVDMGDVGF